jgi:trans-aconitate methyltransferase
VGIDGAQQMIANAESRDKKNEYIQTDIDSFSPVKRFDLIHSMEVFYYLKNPSKTIKRICDNWLNPNGRLIIGIDRYYENFQSHGWEEKVGTPMHLMKEQEWKAILEKSGFFGVKTWRLNSSKDWKGTLVITGKTKQFLQNLQRR